MIGIVMLHNLRICFRLPSFQNGSLVCSQGTLKEARLDAERFLGAWNRAEALRVIL